MSEANNHSLRSFIDVSAESHFPIQNLPFGVFCTHNAAPRVGVAIGEWIVDLAVLERAGLLDVPSFSAVGNALRGVPGVAKNRNATEGVPYSLFNRDSLNAFMALGRTATTKVRQRVSELLRHDEPRLRDNAILRREALVPMVEAEMLLPVEIADYTDFYSSREHATNVGAMFRGPENALMPNWLHLPVAYHGRASSVVVSGTDLHRPRGQTKADDAAGPTFGPSRAVDFELEVGLFIGRGNALGEPIPIASAAEHVFGLVLVNDWSARDIQKWEYVPLGPFLAKNFGTSISPWVVTLDALEPFRVPGPVQHPPPLDYLRSPGDWAYDMNLEVLLQTAAMSEPARICSSNFRHLYWNICQQIAHHASNGCNLRTGDLLASGTISGPTPDSRGSLLEITQGGKSPLTLPSGETRTYLADGDRVTLTGWCQGNGYRVGFGKVTGKLLAPK